MFKFNNFNKNSIYGQYPSCDMINNALRFLLDCKIEDQDIHCAISELKFAILKADGFFHKDVKEKLIQRGFLEEDI